MSRYEEESDVEEIEISEGGKSGREVREFIEKIKAANITQHTVRQWVHLINNTLSIITSNVENHRLQLAKARADQKRLQDDYDLERLKELAQQNLTPYDLMSTERQLSYHYREMLAWKITDNEIQTIVNAKLVEALVSISDYQVESLAIQRMSSHMDQILEHNKNVITQIVTQQNGKIEMIKEIFQEKVEVNMQKNLGEWRKIQQEHIELLGGVIEHLKNQTIAFVQEQGRLMSQGKKAFTDDDLDRLVNLMNKQINKRLDLVEENYRRHTKDLIEDADEAARLKRSKPVVSSIPAGVVASNPAPPHEHEEEFLCDFCGKECRSELELEQHIALLHNDL